MTEDVDKSWNPNECSLDEHRQKMFKEIEQPGFGIHAKPETKPAAEVIPGDTEKADDNG